MTQTLLIDSSENVLFLEFLLGQAFLCWSISDGKNQFEIDENIKEDAKARKKRIQAELARALAVLGIKHSTFYSMLGQGKHGQVKEMLKKHLQERSDDLLEGTEQEITEEFNIHLELADRTTIHEAYQFLIKKYIDGKEDIQQEMFVDIEKLKAKRKEKKTISIIVPIDEDSNISNISDAHPGDEVGDNSRLVKTSCVNRQLIFHLIKRRVYSTICSMQYATLAELHIPLRCALKQFFYRIYFTLRQGNLIPFYLASVNEYRKTE